MAELHADFQIKMTYDDDEGVLMIIQPWIQCIENE